MTGRVRDRDGFLISEGDQVKVLGEHFGTFAGTAVEEFGFVALVDYADRPQSRHYLQPPHHTCSDLARAKDEAS